VSRQYTPGFVGTAAPGLIGHMFEGGRAR
jgi:hypothetical protein